MSLSLEQFVKQLEDTGILSTETLKSFLPPSMNPKDSEELARELVRQKKLTRFQTQLIYQGKGASLVLGNYVILDKVGQGGIGQVYKAEHRRMKRHVAIKVLQSQFVKNSQAVERFKREVEAIGRLNHPHIVAAFDADQFHGTHFLVMEYVEGRDLSSVLKTDGPLPLEVAVNFIFQAARGLQYAHEHGVIHRDIKPANLLLSKDGTVKILDMGLARFDDEVAGLHEALTGTGSVMGTVDFMAPEQCANTKNADARSDIYSLGCTLFNLLTGQMVYGGETVVQKIFSHRDDPIPSIRSVRPELPDAVDAVVVKMLAKQPAERYQTAAEVVIAMQQLSIPVGIAIPAIVPASTTPQSIMTLESDWETPALAPSSAVATPTMNGGDADVSTSPDAEPAHRVRVARRGTSAAESHVKTGLSLGPWHLVGALSAVVILLLGIVALWPRGKSNVPVKAIAAKSPTRPKQNSEELQEEETPPEADGTPVPVVAMPPEADPVATPSAKVSAPPPTTPAPAVPMPTNPPATPAGQEGRTLIVGVGPGEIGDLTKAFEQAQPGDTILIRHRGPLEFSPIDLTGKTPLTIAGDSKDGVDYWPIIRQTILPEDAALAPAPGLFFGKNVKLTFRKLHLGVGGHLRQPITSAFHLDAGKLEFTDCTLTVAASLQGLDPVGPLIPLVQCSGTGMEPLELTFCRTIVRGGRLGGFLKAVRPGPIQIVAEQLVWAGGPAPWLTLQDCAQPCRVQLERTTLYNLSDLATAALAEQQRSAEEPALKLHLENCLLVGQRGGKTPLLRVTAPFADSLEQAVTGRWVGWSGTDIVWHQIVMNDESDKKADKSGDKTSDKKRAMKLKAWCELFGLADRSIIEADPMFRVWPGGVELQEATARDFEPRFARAKKPRDLEFIAGASSKDVSVALSCINSRDLAVQELMGVPRGKPRIWQVHQKNGPFKNLEDALAKVQTDDIVEIIDDAVYFPKRNFTTSAALGVLTCDTPECLTIRGVDDSRAIVVLRDDLQQGSLPMFHPDARSERDMALILISSGCRSLVLDGLHVQAAMAKSTRHSMVMHQGPSLRITNCAFTDLTAAPLAVYGAYHRHRFVSHLSGRWNGQGEWLSWFENDAFVHPTVMQSLPKDARDLESAINISHVASQSLPGVARNVVVRGCLLGSGLIGVTSNCIGPPTEVISFEQCTVIGRMMSFVGDARSKSIFRSNDNLVVAPDNPVLAPALDTHVQGGGNAYWQTSGKFNLEDRDQGSLRLLPGPLLKSIPVFSGNANANDPLRSFRLKPGQAWANIATDGGVVGVRFEYLPTPPPFRPEMLKSK